mgnify:CR=1 FL=1
MLLALDVGNTHVVVGLMEGREVRRSFRIATRRDNAVGDYAVALSQLLELAEVDRQEATTLGSGLSRLLSDSRRRPPHARHDQRTRPRTKENTHHVPTH